MTSAPDEPLGELERVFRPSAANIASAYLTAALLSASGAGLTLVMLRQLWLGGSGPLAVLGIAIGSALFAGGVRVLADVRQFDQLELRLRQGGLEWEDGLQSERAAWGDLARIEEVTYLDGDAAGGPQTPVPRRIAGAVVLCRRDGWRARLDRNRIADYDSLLRALRRRAETEQIPWVPVEQAAVS